MRFISNTINISEIFLISLPFIAFTFIGTLSHEYGHIFVANYFGYETTLHYGSMNYKNNSTEYRIKEIYLRNETEIKNFQPFPEKAIFEKLAKKIACERLFIFIGGPTQTIVTATIGTIFLLLRKRKIHEFGIKFIDWLFVFLALFWLRQVFNLFTSLLNAIIFDNQNYFGGDEKVIATLLKIPKGTIAIPLGVLGILISLHVIFIILPLDKRLNFILGGILGGILGYIIWFEILGPIILP